MAPPHKGCVCGSRRAAVAELRYWKTPRVTFCHERCSASFFLLQSIVGVAKRRTSCAVNADARAVENQRDRNVCKSGRNFYFDLLHENIYILLYYMIDNRSSVCVV